MEKHPKQSEQYTLSSKSQGKNHIILNISAGARWLSHIWLFATPWTVARQAPLSMGFSRQEYWSGLPSPSPGDPPCPGIEPASPHLLNCRQILYQWATMDTQYNLTGHNWVDVGSEWEGWKLQEFCLGRHRGEVWAIRCLGAQGSFDCYWCRRCAHQQLVSKRWPGQTFGANTKAILDESSG